MSGTKPEGQLSNFRLAASELLGGVRMAAAMLAVGALTAAAPGAPLLLAPFWQRLRGHKNFFLEKERERFPTEKHEQYRIQPDHPVYGAMKREMDALLAEAGQKPANLFVVPAVCGVHTGTFMRGRNVVFMEEYLQQLNQPERHAVLQHEVRHLMGKENKSMIRADEFSFNAMQMCGAIALPAAATLYTVAEKLASATLQPATQAVAQMGSAVGLNLTAGNMLYNATLNVVVALPVAFLINRYLTRRAEFASDRYVVEKQQNADALTGALLRSVTLPDPQRREAVHMRQILQRPRLNGATIRHALRWETLTATHPSIQERIRHVYAHAARQGYAKPQLGMDDTWYADQRHEQTIAPTRPVVPRRTAAFAPPPP